MEQREYHIGLGSNLGDPVDILETALETLGRDHRILARSPLYRTRPWGFEEQPDFVNAVIKVTSTLPPRPMLTYLKGMEAGAGRSRTTRWGPRILDLDILLAGAEIIHDPDLTVPHPHLTERAFVLVPLLEIDPGLRHPVHGTPLSRYLGELPADEVAGVIRLHRPASPPP